MSGITALTKIRTRTKGILKAHPGMKYRSAQKQASREYNAGTIPKKRVSKKRRVKRKVSGKREYKVTHRVKKVGALVLVHRKPRRRLYPEPAKPRKPRKKKTRSYAGKRVKVKSYTGTRYRRVGSKKSNTALLVGGLALAGIAAYLLLKKPTTTLPVALVPSSNPATAAAKNNILQYAQAAGLGITALTALINALNGSSDAAVQAASAQVSAGGGIPDLSGGGGSQPWLA